MANDYLQHYGILGMHWGIRRTPEQLGHRKKTGKRLGLKNLKKARTANLNKWGKDADHNTLYIAGYSGSGKSTTALSMAKPGDKVIHLDSYSSPGGSISLRNKDFNAWLDKEDPNWRDISKSGVDKSVFEPFSKEYWKEVNKFRNAIEPYSKTQFKKGHRVIVEGVQIADGWLSKDRNYYKDKPIVLLGTSAIRSFLQAYKRDGEEGAIKNLEDLKEYTEWYMTSNKGLNDIQVVSNAKKGEKWVKEYLKQFN